MKLIDAIREKGAPYWIPDSSRYDLPDFFKELGFKVGAEIGVFTGDNLEKYCKAGLTMYGIDPWAKYRDYRTRSSMDDVYKKAVEKLSAYPKCTLIRKESNEVEIIGTRSLDFVYIDGNHRFDYVAADLVNWTRKVRRGGVV